MPTYAELIRQYAGRRQETLVDSVTAGLSYADNAATELGLLEDGGVLDGLSIAAPFALIAVTEQLRVLRGRKTGRAGVSDAVQRMLKTGAAMGVGALAAAAGGAIAAVPAAMGTRALLGRYQSRALLGVRVRDRTRRLRALRGEREALRRGEAAPWADEAEPSPQLLQERNQPKR